jgi:hypothetical protein
MAAAVTVLAVLAVWLFRIVRPAFVVVWLRLSEPLFVLRC